MVWLNFSFRFSFSRLMTKREPLRKTSKITDEAMDMNNPSSSSNDHSDSILSSSDHLSYELNEKNDITGRNETSIEQTNHETTSTSIERTYKRRKMPMNRPKKF